MTTEQKTRLNDLLFSAHSRMQSIARSLSDINSSLVQIGAIIDSLKDEVRPNLDADPRVDEFESEMQRMVGI